MWMPLFLGQLTYLCVRILLKWWKGEFEMSHIRELTYFLRLQIKQLKDRIFINQAKYIKELLKKFNLENAKTISTPMAVNTKLG